MARSPATPGHAAIREFMLGQDLATRPELQRRHVNTNIAIELHGEEADAVSDLLVYDRVADGHWALVTVGRSSGDWLCFLAISARGLI